MSPNKRFGIVGSLLISSLALAEPKVDLELVLEPPGPYVGGEYVTLHVWLRSLITCNVQLERIQFDFRASDAAIDFDRDFEFDYSSIAIPDPNYYQDFTSPQLPIPRTFNLIACFCPFYFILLHAGEELHIGSVGFLVPGEYRRYEIDVLNALVPGSTATGFGSVLGAGGIDGICPPGTDWTASDGELTGGRASISTPPPIPIASVWSLVGMGTGLLLVGSLLSRRSRRGSAKTAMMLLVATFLAMPVKADPVESSAQVPIDIVSASVDSGVVSASGSGNEAVVVYSGVVQHVGASWIRLRFDQCQLAGSASSSDASFLRLTSLDDGAVQILNAVSIVEWVLTSAYFNGDSVLLELLAYPGTGDNRVTVAETVGGVAGETNGGEGGATDDCGVDDRIPSADRSVARLRNIFYETPRFERVCTAFLFDDRPADFLGAGHCCRWPAQYAGFPSIVEFQVPVSDGEGTPRAAKPEDQYVITRCSIQYDSQGIGADWCYFRVFPNRNVPTAPNAPAPPYFPLAKQGVSKRLVRGAFPEPNGQRLSVAGYGYDVPQPRSHTQQIDSGPFTQIEAFWFAYSVYVYGGTSGAPVPETCTDTTYGINTHLACPVPGFLGNLGTRIDHADLQYAIAHPEIVCDDCNGNGEPDACDVDCSSPGESCNQQHCGQSQDCNENAVPDECERNEDCQPSGVAGYGTWDICDTYNAVSEDCDGNFVPDECENQPDCHEFGQAGYGTWDLCDIITQTSADCNGDLVPDDCEGPEQDCNGNAVPDLCDIGSGASRDCNCDNRPDECDLSVASGGVCTSSCDPDCNENGTLDECDLALPDIGDCNDNQIPDDCDIAAGTSQDCNANGKPDVCEGGAACWLPDGTCIDTFTACCSALNGQYYAAWTCATIPFFPANGPSQGP